MNLNNIDRNEFENTEFTLKEKIMESYKLYDENRIDNLEDNLKYINSKISKILKKINIYKFEFIKSFQNFIFKLLNEFFNKNCDILKIIYQILNQLSYYKEFTLNLDKNEINFIFELVNTEKKVNQNEIVLCIQNIVIDYFNYNKEDKLLSLDKYYLYNLFMSDRKKYSSILYRIINFYFIFVFYEFEKSVDLFEILINLSKLLFFNFTEWADIFIKLFNKNNEDNYFLKIFFESELEKFIFNTYKEPVDPPKKLLKFLKNLILKINDNTTIDYFIEYFLLNDDLNKNWILEILNYLLNNKLIKLNEKIKIFWEKILKPPFEQKTKIHISFLLKNLLENYNNECELNNINLEKYYFNLKKLGLINKDIFYEAKELIKNFGI